jgi:hypothetical protein
MRTRGRNCCPCLRTEALRCLRNGPARAGAPAALADHIVEEARADGWDTLRNGELLDAAEAAGFDVFVTTDRNLRYQHNLAGRKIAFIVLGNGRWRLIKTRLPFIGAVVSAAAPGSFAEIDIPIE